VLPLGDERIEFTCLAFSTQYESLTEQTDVTDRQTDTIPTGIAFYI